MAYQLPAGHSLTFKQTTTTQVTVRGPPAHQSGTVVQNPPIGFLGLPSAPTRTQMDYVKRTPVVVQQQRQLQQQQQQIQQLQLLLQQQPQQWQQQPQQLQQQPQQWQQQQPQVVVVPNGTPYGNPYGAPYGNPFGAPVIVYRRR